VFPEVIVELAAAIICFATTCHPILVGAETPLGEFQLTHYSTSARGYGGDLLAFKETNKHLFAIHRVIDVPGQERLDRLKSPAVKRRSRITGGCINVEPTVYDELVKCCYASKLVIK
jgi:hypothetical protein